MDEGYHNSLNQVALESEKAYDNKLFAVSTGGVSILFTVATINDSVETNWAFYVSASLFVISIIINMVSHIQTSMKIRKVISDENRKTIAGTPKAINKIDKQNKNIYVVNFINLGVVIFAILAAFIFVLIK